MINTLFSTLAPHLCCGCGKIGELLCENCKYDIDNYAAAACLLCGNNNYNTNLCETCMPIVRRGWCVGERSGALRKLIDDYKFENVKSAHKTLATLLHGHLPQLPENTVVVPIPTISSHIRQRGYDHAALLARSFAHYRNLAYRPLLRRATNKSQRHASRQERYTQAKAAFSVQTSPSPHHPYLLVDDIITTGATLIYAARSLRTAGAQEVWIAAVARQPLD